MVITTTPALEGKGIVVGVTLDVEALGAGNMLMVSMTGPAVVVE
jgi:uncharacterized protein YbjQ (UPF0145 family)